jgi:PAS domain S-box-containing protein
MHEPGSAAIAVLYVEDGRPGHDRVRDVLEKDGRFEMTEAPTRAELERQLATGRFDVVLSDSDALGFRGMQVLEAVRERDPRVPVVILSVSGSEELAVQALRHDAADSVVRSPEELERLAPTIEAAIARAHLRYERERSELDRAESERRLRVAVDGMPESFVIYDAELRYRFVNAYLLAGLGWPIERLLGKRDQEIHLPEVYASYLPMLERTAATRERQTAEITMEYQGNQVELVLTYIPLLGENGELREILGIAHDVTERKAWEAQLSRLIVSERAGREQLEALSRRLVALQEEERRAIARELHDEIGQLLTGLKLLLGSRQPSGVTQAEQVVGELLRRVRDLSMDLRPALLDDLGLLPALLWLVDRYTQRTKIEVDLRHEALDARLSSEVETAAYRVVQEALTNVARHAAVQKVQVVLRREKDRLSILVEDAGRGFDVERGLADGTSGLTGMRERALLLGGRFEVDSRRGVGTRVLAELPLTDAGSKVIEKEERT